MMDVGQAITEAMREQRWRDAWRVAEAGIRWHRPINTANLPEVRRWCPEWPQTRSDPAEAGPPSRT